MMLATPGEALPCRKTKQVIVEMLGGIVGDRCLVERRPARTLSEACMRGEERRRVDRQRGASLAVDREVVRGIQEEAHPMTRAEDQETAREEVDTGIRDGGRPEDQVVGLEVVPGRRAEGPEADPEVPVERQERGLRTIAYLRCSRS